MAFLASISRCSTPKPIEVIKGYIFDKIRVIRNDKNIYIYIYIYHIQQNQSNHSSDSNGKEFHFFRVGITLNERLFLEVLWAHELNSRSDGALDAGMARYR